MEKVAEAVRYTFIQPSQPDARLVITLAGRLLVTNQLTQEFPSAEEAREHLERVMKLRKREGLILQLTERLSAQELHQAVEESDDDVRVTLHDGAFYAQFPGGADKAAVVCVKLLARLKKDAPRRVTLKVDSQTPGSHWAKAIKGRQLLSVRAFVVDDQAQSATRQAHNTIGDLSASLEAFPALERLFVTGQLELTKCSHATLSELYALGDPLHSTFLQALGASQLPALQRLVLALASESTPASQATWQEALLSLRAPMLEEVHVYGVEDVVGALQGFLERGLPASWQLLSLTGAVDDETRLLDLLRAHRTKLAALQQLVLPLANEVSEPACVEARALLSNLRDSSELPDLTLPATYASW